MRVYKITLKEEVTENDDLTPKELQSKEVAEFKNYKIEKGERSVLSLIKSGVLSEIITEEDTIKVLQGKKYVKKVVKTEYYIADGEGINITNSFNDDFMKHLAGDDTYEFVQVGDKIIKTKVE